MSRKFRVLAFDQGCVTGMCAITFHDGAFRVEVGSTEKLKTKPAGISFHRFQYLLEKNFRSTAKLFDAVFWEDVQGNWDNRFQMGQAALIQITFRSCPHLQAIPPSRWKKIAVGKGNAKKIEVAEALAHKTRLLPDQFNEHEWDAMGIAIAGLSEVGIKTARRRLNVAGMTRMERKN